MLKDSKDPALNEKFAAAFKAFNLYLIVLLGFKKIEPFNEEVYLYFKIFSNMNFGILIIYILGSKFKKNDL